jgi:hypothetical protein
VEGKNTCHLLGRMTRKCLIGAAMSMVRPKCSTDVRSAIDPILMRMHQIAGALSDFAGHFIRNQLKR